MFLFTGKGGAGKTTCAAAFSLALAGADRQVLLVSLDPAHNLGDVLDLRLGAAPREVAPGLFAMEADLERVVQEKTREARRLVEEEYRYLSVASLDPLFSILGQAPGVEEQAAGEVLLDLRDSCSRRGRILVADLPPTGQAWRILSLPALSLRWARSLLDLRRKVLDRRRTLFHVLGEETPARDMEGRPLPLEEDQDPVACRLREVAARNEGLARDLQDRSAARVVGVALPERLSLLEAARLEDRLRRWGIPLSALVLNRAGRDLSLKEWDFPARKPDLVLENLDREPRGREGLAPLGRELKRLFLE